MQAPYRSSVTLAPSASPRHTTVFEVVLPFLDDGTSTTAMGNTLASAATTLPSVSGSPVRGGSNAAVTAANGSILAAGELSEPASMTRGRPDPIRIGPFPIGNGGGSNSHAGLDGPLSSSGTTNAAAAMTGGALAAPTLTSTTSGTSALTKPTLSPAHTRCCPVDQWVPDAHVVNSMAPDCSTSFSLFSRKYHCGMCGRVFCSTCCSTTLTIPASGGGGRSATAAVAASAAAAAAGRTAAMNNIAAAYTGGGGGATGGSECPTNAGPSNPPSFVGFGASPENAVVTAAGGNASSSTTAASTIRVCSGCRHELYLVVSTRRETGERRRKSRGELKMLQWTLVVNILSFLPLPDLLETALVSSDFYFMSKDNVIWYRYNMMRWLKDVEQTQTQLSIAPSVVAPSRTSRRLGMGRRSAARGSSFKAAPLLQDATALTESEAAKRVISLHARYSFTQFLDFTRRQEMARCEGLSSFSVGSRILLSSPVRVALIGPSGIGKTRSIRAFLGDGSSGSNSSGSGCGDRDIASADRTVGFTRHVKAVRLVGGLTADITLHLYDVSGHHRYEALRRFICAQCHAIGLCYNPASKVTLVEAADVMMGLEAALGPQPVVVCGLLDPQAALLLRDHHQLQQRLEPGPPQLRTNSSLCGLDSPQTKRAVSPAPVSTVTEDDAIGISVRTAGSIQCAVDQCEPFYNKIVQCLLDRLASATMAGTATVADISGEVTDGHGSVPGSVMRRTGVGASSSGGGSLSAAASVARRPKASKETAQELLNLTMQPCALDILLDPK